MRQRPFIGAAVLTSVLVGTAAALVPTDVSINSARHLDGESDRIAFRDWFAFLTEVQYFIPPAQRAPEIIDCSSLVRYAYREALRQHNAIWANQIGLPIIPAIPSVTKYSFPHTPTGPDLFQIAPGGYAEFANAETLRSLNSFFLSRDIRRALRGDVLFFRQRDGQTSHTMVILGTSQITSGADRLVTYDTGPEGTKSGEIKRLTIEQLLSFPDPRWRPIPQNSAFLGVFRWNILSGTE